MGRRFDTIEEIKQKSQEQLQRIPEDSFQIGLINKSLRSFL